MKSKAKYLLLLIIPAIMFLSSSVTAADTIIVNNDAEFIDLLSKAFRAGEIQIRVNFAFRGGESVTYSNLGNLIATAKLKGKR